MSSPVTKETLRKTALARRLELPAEAQKEAARGMMKNFFASIPLADKAVIAGYWPVRGEMDVLPLLTDIHAQGHVCALPHVVDQRIPLVFFRWEPSMPMVGGAFGIREPDPAYSSRVIPDVVLLPLLAFDDTGHRLGYGAGFYDRTLEYLGTIRRPLAVGMAYSFSQQDKLPVDVHDHQMDFVVTEKEVFTFKTGETC